MNAFCSKTMVFEQDLMIFFQYMSLNDINGVLMRLNEIKEIK
jgi:hypothetical protein